MLKKILIANRGEIACRIIRTARKLGVATVAVYSDADARALFVEQADEAVHIGPSPAPESYLRGDKIIAAAKATGAEGIHPGYGFLSENADFADAVTKAGLKFIGPSAAAMRALGGKAAAKEIAIACGVPVVPGYLGAAQDAQTLAREAEKIGYPVMIKAVAGGGGRGMRLVERAADLPELLASAQREAEGAFGNPGVLLEKVVVRPRHIEVQVFGDAHGNVVHMFERDCTLQRRNQKVVEEAPAPGMSEALREMMCAAAVKLAKHVGYEGAGTVEFLVEGNGSHVAPSVAHPQPALGPDARWYFIEMNTRLQVEHPVTEEITGLDLVEWQLRVASGEKLPRAQSDIRMSGHAIEVRLCAEDPTKGFLPSVGRISIFERSTNEGYRLETGVRQGAVVSPFYDSMIAKLISHGSDRAAAISQLRCALASLIVGGIKTNAAFLDKLISDADVASARMDTSIIARKGGELAAFVIDPSRHTDAVGGLLNRGSWHMPVDAVRHQFNPWEAEDGFGLGPPREQSYRVLLDGAPHTFSLTWEAGAPRFREAAPAALQCVYLLPGLDMSNAVAVSVQDLVPVEIAFPTYDATAVDDGADGSAVRAPINGKVARVFVAEGAKVAKGDRIAVVEAMKMEHVLHASRAGVIAKVAASEGQQVNQGTLIASIAEE